MNKLKRFTNTVFVYFMGSVCSKLVSFILLPLYTSKISPTQYGTYNLVITFINLFAPLLFFQIWDGMFRFSFDYNDEKDKYKIISNALVVCLTGMVCYFFVFFLVQCIVGIEYYVYIFFYGLLLSLHYFYGYICRIFLKNKLYIITGFCSTLIMAILNIVLILIYHWDIKSLYVSQSIGMLFQIIIIEYRFKVFSHFQIRDVSRNVIVKMIKFSVPLCFSSISFWLLSGFTNVLIANNLGTAENGLFAVANKFSSMVVLIITMFQYAWNELAYLMSNDKNRGEIYNICIDLLLKISLLGIAGVCILIKIIFPYFIHIQYEQAISIIPATIIGSIMNAMAGFIATLFMTENKTKDIMYGTMIAALINIFLGIIATNIFGLHGATISLAIAFTFLMLLRLFQAKKRFNLQVNSKVMFVLILILILAVMEYYIVENIFCDIVTIILLLGLFLLFIKKYIRLFVKRSNK